MRFEKDLGFLHVDAKEIPCLTGKGAPTVQTEGAPGVLYMDTDTGVLYKCRGGTAGEYCWENMAPVKGVDYFTTADKAELAGMVLELLQGKVISGYVAEDGSIIINGLPDGNYTVKYEMSDGSTLEIGDLVLDTRVYYSVTGNLSNCVSSNSAISAPHGDSYQTTITANAGYELESVTVTMGGVDITAQAVSGGSISIAGVTGDIVITAVAKEAVVVPSYTNLLPLAVDTDGSPYNGGKGYKSGYKMSTSSGNESATTGAYCSGFMPVSSIYDAIRVKNVTLSSAANVNNFTFYDASKTKVGNNACNGSAGAFHVAVVDEGNGVYRVQPKSYLSTSQSVAFFRFSCGGITDETIVTVNEEIV